MIQKVVMFRTTDGKMFEVEAKALKHQDKLDLVNEIIELLGGHNHQVQSRTQQDFYNGEGFVVISEENFKSVEKLISKLLEEVGISGSITSNRAYDNPLTGDVARIYASVFKGEDGVIRRLSFGYYQNCFSGKEIK